MPPCIIFDFDGVIVDTAHHYAHIFNELADGFRCKKVQEEDVDLLKSMSADEILKHLNITWWKLPWVVVRMKWEVNKHVEELPLVPGIPEVLHELRERGFSLAILTTNSKKNVKDYLLHHDLEFFDQLLGNTGVKNKWRSILKFSRRFKVAKKDMLYIGDEVRDIHSCRRAGISVAAVTWGYNSGERLKAEDPDFFVDTPEGLIQMAEDFKKQCSR